MRIDAHQHFWTYAEDQYPWIPKQSPLHRDWLPGDWWSAANQAGFHGSIAVQARQSLEESRWLLRLSDSYSFIQGVVGWVDLCSEGLVEQLAELTQHPKFVGVRHVVQDEPDDRFMLRPEFLRGIGMLKAFDLTYDLLIYPKHLPAAVELVRQFPQQPFVLDHMAKPPIRNSTLSPWREHIRALARASNLVCKVSGLLTQAHWTSWRKADFRPYLDTVFEAFGEERVLFGSDWPVCLLAGSYRQVVELAEDYTKGLTRDAREKFFGGNGARFYGV